MKDAGTARNKKIIKIGIIIGAGTGRRLAELFKDFLHKLVKKHKHLEVEFLEDPRLKSSNRPYHSFKSIEQSTKGDSKEFEKISNDEVNRLVKTTKQWYKSGVKAVFRTSINAETLYLFRQEVHAIKEFGLRTPSGGIVFFVRDQSEGYYANEHQKVTPTEITFSGRFTQEHQQNLAKYALKRAEQVFSGKKFQKWAIYKHHLFGGVIEGWIKYIDNSIVVYQPDSGLTELNKFFYLPLTRGTHNLLVICSNEVGDIIYESVMKMIDPESKLFLFAKNTYLSKPFLGNFGDFQTVHGSADDFEDSNELLPYATFHIAAEFAEKILGIPKVKSKMDKAFVNARRKGLKETSLIISEVYRLFKI